jgi:hypothetical protein
LIIYHGPGSWKQDALWDEYIVTVRNPRGAPIVIESANLIDSSGREHSAFADPWKLEEHSRELCREYDRTGELFAKEAAGAVAVVGGVAGGAAVAASVLTSTGGATVTVLQGPLAAVTVPTYLIDRAIVNHDARSDLEADFHLRRLKTPARIVPGQTRTGSLYFPMVPSPRSLVLKWTADGQSGETILPLEFLRDLHRPTRNHKEARTH